MVERRLEGRFTNPKGIMLFIGFGENRGRHGNLKYLNGKLGVVLRNGMLNELRRTILAGKFSIFPLIAIHTVCSDRRVSPDHEIEFR